MKHAFLIMAHGNLEILNILLSMLEDPLNDIYLHLDSKMGDVKLDRDYENLYILEKRMDVSWGDISQINLEMMLFEKAYSHGPYMYYHLLSGVDLPLKSNNYIHNFFEANFGKEFVGYSFSIGSARERVLYYRILSRYQKNFIVRKISSVFIRFQKFWGLERLFPYEIKKGANWVSVTNCFVQYLLSKKTQISKNFSYTFCADEIFLQSILWNSQFKENIYNKDDEFKSCVRKIDWNRGNPYVWTNDDFDELMRSDAIFARKFDNSDMEIVKRIKKGVME